MAYEVRMYFENYYSGVTTYSMIYKKDYSNLEDAIKKFKSLAKNIEDIDAWKKTRSRVRELELEKLKPEDFADGYCKFDKFVSSPNRYWVERSLLSAYGFDHERQYALIFNLETNDAVYKLQEGVTILGVQGSVPDYVKNTPTQMKEVV